MPVKRLSAGLRVLRFDNRDVGLSTKFDVGYTLEDMAEDVRLLLDELHIDSAHVVGTSMGGWVAQNLAVAHPSRGENHDAAHDLERRQVGVEIVTPSAGGHVGAGAEGRHGSI